MSNILIIKHGSLGDLIQANGAIRDIKESNKNKKVFLLTSEPYSIFMSECPYVDGVIIDKRLPRWNFFYLNKLKKTLSRYDFNHVYDLQNSSRTKFYRRFILSKPVWSSTETTLEAGQKKTDFDKEPVLDRIELQLQKSDILINYTKKIDLSWAIEDLSKLIKQYANEEYILVFPFCSKKHKNKKWPYFKELIYKLKTEFKNKYPILVAPSQDEIEEAYELKCKVVLDNDNPINIKMLVSLINSAKFIISNDTGPAHIASHLNKDGLVLFGSHTTAKKVSIGNLNFKTLSVENLSKLDANTVIQKIKTLLN